MLESSTQQLDDPRRLPDAHLMVHPAPSPLPAPDMTADQRSSRAVGGQTVRAGMLEDSLGYAVKRAQVRCEEALVAVLPADLSPTRMTGLATIEANPGITQSALGNALHIAAPSVVKVVDVLEGLGFVERRASPLDRRVYALFLTTAGRDVLRECERIVAASEEDIASRLTKAERALLIELLSRVAA